MMLSSRTREFKSVTARDRLASEGPAGTRTPGGGLVAVALFGSDRLSAWPRFDQSESPGSARPEAAAALRPRPWPPRPPRRRASSSRDRIQLRLVVRVTCMPRPMPLSEPDGHRATVTRRISGLQ